jgi:hypothetical protein
VYDAGHILERDGGIARCRQRFLTALESPHAVLHDVPLEGDDEEGVHGQTQMRVAGAEFCFRLPPLRNFLFQLQLMRLQTRSGGTQRLVEVAKN